MGVGSPGGLSGAFVPRGEATCARTRTEEATGKFKCDRGVMHALASPRTTEHICVMRSSTRSSPRNTCGFVIRCRVLISLMNSAVCCVSVALSRRSARVEVTRRQHGCASRRIGIYPLRCVIDRDRLADIAAFNDVPHNDLNIALAIRACVRRCGPAPASIPQRERGLNAHAGRRRSVAGYSGDNLHRLIGKRPAQTADICWRACHLTSGVARSVNSRNTRLICANRQRVSHETSSDISYPPTLPSQPVTSVTPVTHNNIIQNIRHHPVTQ
jgi:hypothetical protein